MTGRMSGHPGSYNGGGSAIVRRMTIRGRGARRPWHWLLLIALLLASGGAMALGLGQIRVLSAPGEPFLAEIPIISNEPGDSPKQAHRFLGATGGAEQVGQVLAPLVELAHRLRHLPLRQTDGLAQVGDGLAALAA